MKKLFSKCDTGSNGGATTPLSPSPSSPAVSLPDAIPAIPTDIPGKQSKTSTTNANTTPQDINNNNHNNDNDNKENTDTTGNIGIAISPSSSLPTLSPTVSLSISPTDTRTLPLTSFHPTKLDTTNLEPDSSSSSSHSPGSDTQAPVTPSSPLDSTISPKSSIVPSAALLSPAVLPPAKPRPSVHFAPSVRTFLEAQGYTHQQRYNLSCGALQVFDRPPTNHYRFNTLRENGVRGTYLQLVTSSSTEGINRTWDSCTPLPSFAARYQNTYVTKSERTVYFEVEILSLGFSKFSSLDEGKPPPLSPPLSPESGAGIAAGGGLSVPVTAPRPSTSPSPPQQNGIDSPRFADDSNLSPTSPTSPTSKKRGGGIGIGFVVKCVSPETVAYVRRRSSLRPNDEMPLPSSVNGAGLFWWSGDGDVHVDGVRTHKHVFGGVGDTVGIGITYKLPPSLESSSGDVTVEEKQRRRSSYLSANLAAEELQPIPTSVFLTVNGEKTDVCSSTSTNPFEVKLPEYLLGTHDVFPCIVVQGAGVECKVRIGEAVKWDGEGGRGEMSRLALGDKKAAKKKKEEGKGEKDGDNGKKKVGWWRNFGWGGGSTTNGSAKEAGEKKDGDGGGGGKTVVVQGIVEGEAATSPKSQAQGVKVEGAGA